MIAVLVGICASIVLAHALLHNMPPLEEGSDSEMSETHCRRLDRARAIFHACFMRRYAQQRHYAATLQLPRCHAFVRGITSIHHIYTLASH